MSLPSGIAEEEAHHDQPRDARHERLQDRERDEQDHRRQKHHPPADLVGQPASEHRADQGAALRAGSREPQQQRVGIILLLDENEHERDGIEVPGLHQNGSHHQPTDAIAGGVVSRNEMSDGAVDRRLVGSRHRQVRFLHSWGLIRALFWAQRATPYEILSTRSRCFLGAEFAVPVQIAESLPCRSRTACSGSIAGAHRATALSTER